MPTSLILLAVVLVLVTVAGAPPSSEQFRFPDGVASGDVTDSSALLWTRASSDPELVVQVATDRTFRGAIEQPATATFDRDHTAKVEVSGLSPGTRYVFRFVGLHNGPTSQVGEFVTAPAPSSEGDVRFIYSGDSDGTLTPNGMASFRDEIATVAGAMRLERPDLFIYLGDTIYSDSGLASAPAAALDEYRAKYRELRSIGQLRTLLAATNLLAVWDDHEVVNDYAPTYTLFPAVLFPPSLTRARVAAGQRAFREWFPVREGPGGVVYRSIRYGRDLLLIVLDERSYRSNPLPVLVACDVQPGAGIIPDLAPTLPQPLRTAFSSIVPVLARSVSPACLTALNDPARTMLGAAQKAWLKRTLAASDAAFNVIVNEVPVQELFFLPYDRWEGFPSERDEILRFIRDPAIGVRGKVVWLTTDTHAHIANDVYVRTFTGGPPDPSGTYEVITGPMGTNTFAAEIESALRDAGIPPEIASTAPGVFREFLLRTLGAECVELDRPGYAVVDLDAGAGTLTIRPRAPGADGSVDICPAPIVVMR